MASQSVALHAQTGFVEQGSAVTPASSGSNGRPISNSSIYMYTVGLTGYGGNPTSLLVDNGTGAVQLDSAHNGFVTSHADGSFSLTGLYTVCTDPSSTIYLVAIGGNNGTYTNPYIEEISVLPLPCSGLTPTMTIFINEATTVAAALALGSLVTPTNGGISMLGPSGQAIMDAVAYANSLVDSLTGVVQAHNSGNVTVNTIADILSSCVSSNGPIVCENLTSRSLNGLSVPQNTWQVALSLAYDPSISLGSLYSLIDPQAAYQPDLPAPPPSWSLTGPEFPVISNISPQPIGIQATLHITGCCFGNAQSTNEVMIGGAQGDVISWSNHEIDASVTPGSTSGYVEVYLNGYGSNIVSFRLSPSPTNIATQMTLSLSPVSSNYGDTVSALVSVTSTGNYVPLGQVTCAYGPGIGAGPVILDSFGNATVPLQGLPPGTDTVYCTFAGTYGYFASYASAVEVVSSPANASGPIIQSVGVQNGSILVSGLNFGGSQGPSLLYLNGSLITPTSWHDSTIVLPPQAGVSHGTVLIVTNNGNTSSQFAFNIPIVTGLSLYEGPTLIGIVVQGYLFGFGVGNLDVYMGTTQLTILGWSPTELIVQIPPGTTSGIVNVIVSGITSQSTSNFNVIPAASCITF